jgi:hypothetical protein
MTGLLIAGLIVLLAAQLFGIVSAVYLVGKPGGKPAGITAISVGFNLIYTAVVVGALVFVLNH